MTHIRVFLAGNAFMSLFIFSVSHFHLRPAGAPPEILESQLDLAASAVQQSEGTTPSSKKSLLPKLTYPLLVQYSCLLSYFASACCAGCNIPATAPARSVHQMMLSSFEATVAVAVTPGLSRRRLEALDLCVACSQARTGNFVFLQPVQQ